MAGRGDRPMVIVDISVPRDVNAAVAEVEGVALFDIDDLERVVETNLNGRRLEAERAEGFVIGAVQGFSAWRRGLNASPAIASLHARGEEIRRAELARMEAQWEGLSDADRERLEALTKGIVEQAPARAHRPRPRGGRGRRRPQVPGDPAPPLRPRGADRLLTAGRAPSA